MSLKKRIEKIEDIVFQNQEKQQGSNKYVPALFYCGWLSEQTEELIKIKKDVESCYPYCCFNHLVGLPTIKYEDDNNVIVESQPISLWVYEKDVIDKYEATKFFAINKCRGAGISEILTIRYMLYKYTTTRIFNRKCLVVGGIRLAESLEYLARMKELADKIPFVYRILPKSESPSALVFKFGVILACPSNPNVVRSYQNIGDVLLEESAFWNLIDDEPVLKAAEPHVAKSSAHIGVISTPNGQRGFFWTKIFNPQIKTRYYKHVLNWRQVIDVPIPVISKKEVLRTKEEDLDTYEQEFDNQFLISANRAFGDFAVADFESEEFDEILNY